MSDVAPAELMHGPKRQRKRVRERRRASDEGVAD